MSVVLIITYYELFVMFVNYNVDYRNYNNKDFQRNTFLLTFSLCFVNKGLNIFYS